MKIKDITTRKEFKLVTLRSQWALILIVTKKYEPGHVIKKKRPHKFEVVTISKGQIVTWSRNTLDNGWDSGQSARHVWDKANKGGVTAAKPASRSKCIKYELRFNKREMHMDFCGYL